MHMHIWLQQQATSVAVMARHIALRHVGKGRQHVHAAYTTAAGAPLVDMQFVGVVMIL